MSAAQLHVQLLHRISVAEKNMLGRFSHFVLLISTFHLQNFKILIVKR